MANTKTLLFSLLLLAVLLIASCSEKVTCNSPYIKVGTDCCLDQDGNRICDEDIQTKMSLEQCKAEYNLTEKTEIKTETITKYICPDGSEVDSKSDCQVNEPPKEPSNPFETYKLKDATPQDGAVTLFEVTPKCSQNINALELHYSLKWIPKNARILVKDSPSSDFVEEASFDTDLEDYVYAGVCKSAECPTDASRQFKFTISPGKYYVIKMEFDESRYFPDEPLHYTREVLLDLTDNSKFLRTDCGQ